MAPALLLSIVKASSFLSPTCRSSNSCLSQIACRVASAEAMYSASVVDSATVACRRLFHATTPPNVLKMYPVVDCRVSKSPPPVGISVPHGNAFVAPCTCIKGEAQLCCTLDVPEQVLGSGPVGVVPL